MTSLHACSRYGLLTIMWNVGSDSSEFRGRLRTTTKQNDCHGSFPLDDPRGIFSAVTFSPIFLYFHVFDHRL